MNKNNPVIALVQHPPVFMNLQASVDKACTLIQEIANHPADIVVFPETWLPGYPVWLDVAPKAGLWDYPPVRKLHRLLHANALTDTHPVLKKLQEAAVNTGLRVIMGAHEKDGGTLYNTTFYLDKDGSFTTHRKLIPTYTERLIWGMGDGSTLNTLKTEWGTIGALICWEHWMPMARAAMHAQKEHIHVAQWPWVKDLHQLCSRHYAFEGQCFVAASGGLLSKNDMVEGLSSLNDDLADREIIDFIESIPVGRDELLLKGGSALMAPDSSYVMEPIYGEAGIYYAEANLDLINEGNLFLDSDGHYSRPDIFNLQVNTSPHQNVSFSPKNQFEA